MNRNYFILTALMLLLAAGLLFLPDRENYKEIDPEVLMRSVIQSSKYVSVDDVARELIERDPTLMLVDVRSEEDFNSFSLPGAVNMPMDSSILTEFGELLGIKGIKTVFYSNDDLLADQAWVVAKRMGYDQIYVMKGGLNKWVTSIIKPQPPDETESALAWEKYEFRKGAGMYFTGSNTTMNTEKQQAVTVKRRKKTAVTAGGC